MISHPHRLTVRPQGCQALIERPDGLIESPAAGSDQEANSTVSLSPCITKRRELAFVRDTFRS